MLSGSLGPMAGELVEFSPRHLAVEDALQVLV